MMSRNHPTIPSQKHPQTAEQPTPEKAEGVPARITAWTLLVSGLVGLAASFILALEKYWLQTNPFYVPSCTINAIASCTPVMNSEQATAFGFPNPYIGIAAYPVIAATGAMLLAGGRLTTWYRIGLQIGATAGTAFVFWLMFQSLIVINALCLYCIASWITTFAILWYVTLTNLNHIHRLPGPAAKFVHAATRNHSTILSIWLLLVGASIVISLWTPTP